MWGMAAWGRAQRDVSNRTRGIVRAVTLSKWAGWIVFVLLLVAVAAWWMRRETIPASINLSTASRHGQYHRFAEVFAPLLAERTRSSVVLATSEGSGENVERLADGSTDLAIIQNGSVRMTDIAVIAPLYDDVIHVVVRRDAGVATFSDLLDMRVACGPDGSGMRITAEHVLDYYGIDTDPTAMDARFAALRTDESLDAAIVTTGYVNSELEAVLKDARFELIGIDDADALATRYPYYSTVEIPRGLYQGRGTAVPAIPVRTLATTAMLVAREDVSAPLVEEAVAALYEVFPRWNLAEPRSEWPSILTRTEARNWSSLPLHPAAQQYLEPEKGIGILADAMENMAHAKELLFALGAGLYFLWVRRRRLTEKRAKESLVAQRQRLQWFLNETVRIEESQIDIRDRAKLKSLLDEVTRVKIRAIDELTHEELKGDRVFSIFLMQCANLSRKILAKISMS